MTPAVLESWIAQAREWQPLLAGLLGVLAAIILAMGIIKAAKIRAAASGDRLQNTVPQDLRSLEAAPTSVDTDTIESIDGQLDNLRSMLRSALSCLSATSADDETARSQCTRIAAFQWKHLPHPFDEDSRMRETYAAFLAQFEMLRLAVGKEWSPSETSAILIQLNASARALSAILKKIESGNSEISGHQTKN